MYKSAPSVATVIIASSLFKSIYFASLIEAIMLAIANESIDVLGITCVGGNSTLENTKINALKVCSLIDRIDIPIYAGESKPMKLDLVTAAHVHGKSGLDIDGSHIEINKNYFIQDLHAVDFIIQTCYEEKDPIYLCPTGPLTNIAMALVMAPDIAERIQGIVLMGGSTWGSGNRTPAAEFNILVDPNAADIVFSCGSGVTASVLALAYSLINAKYMPTIYDGSWSEYGKN